MQKYVEADYHTHTTYSHGTGSVLDSAMQAKKLNMTQIAITDHGFSHIAFGLKRNKVHLLRQDIINAKEQTGVDILLGVEANITSFKGDVDVVQKDLENIDILVMGYHKSVKSSFHQFLNFIFGNIFFSLIKHTPKKIIKKNTDAYIKALNKYPIDIISHLGTGCKVDCGRVATECAKTHTYIELNGKRIHFSKEQVDDMLKTDVMFVLNSDAHSPERIGDCALGEQVVQECGIPLDRIANLNSQIIIKSKKDFIIK